MSTDELRDLMDCVDREEEVPFKNSGLKGSFTPSTALLNRRLYTFTTHRMLTQYEIELLRKSKQEIGEAARKQIQNEKERG